MGVWWWALFSLDGVAPSRMVCVSASVDLPLPHKVQKFSSGTGSPGWSRKKGSKTVVVVVVVVVCRDLPLFIQCLQIIPMILSLYTLLTHAVHLQPMPQIKTHLFVISVCIMCLCVFSWPSCWLQWTWMWMNRRENFPPSATMLAKYAG